MIARSLDSKTLESDWKILIIDDDEDDYLIAREMLKEAKGRKFEVRWASTYASGREELFSNHYNAVLMDYDLGMHSGIELIREANERGFASPLILFTGRGNYEVDVEAMEAGATMYLTKGEVNPLLLERAIRYAVELKHKEQALRFSEERFYTAFNANPNAQVISRLEDGRIEYINESFERLFGFQREEVLGRTSIELNMFVNPGQRDEAVQRIRADHFLRDFELDIQTKSGEIRQASLSVELISLGHRTLMLTVIQDITSRKKVEEELRLSEERYRVAVINAPAIYAQTDRELRYQWIYNPHPDFEPGAVIGKRDDELEDSEDVRRLVARKQQVLDSGVGLREELFFHRSDGVHTYDMTIEPLHGPDGQIVGVTTTAFDITELKRKEQSLKESEGRLRSLIESTRNNYIALDREWRFTYANNHYGKVMGVDPEALIGKTYWEVFPQYLGTEIEENYRKVMETRLPLHYRQEGVYTARQFDVSIYPTDEGIVVFSIDRTEELHYQQQLEAERARLEAVLQGLPVGVWIIDAHGRIVEKNEQADRIWAGDAPLLENVEQYQEYQAWNAKTGKKLEPNEYPVAVALQTGKPVEQIELRIRRFDGTDGAVLVSAKPIKDSEGRLVGVVGINIDITERKQANGEPANE